jgi:hypothetical protein
VFGSIDNPVSVNRYSYAWAAPLNMWDPDGRAPDFADVKCGDLGDALVTDCLIAQGGSRGAIEQNLSRLNETVAGSAKIITTTTAGVVAGAACGAAAYVTRNPMAVGAAASTCGGAASRATSTALDGGSLRQVASAAFNPKSVVLDGSLGALTGGLGGTARTSLGAAFRSGSVDALAGGLHDAATVLSNGGSLGQAWNAAVSTSRLTDFAIGSTSGLASHTATNRARHIEPAKPAAPKPRTSTPKVPTEAAGGPGGRSIVIGEDMEGRVIPKANELGADYYDPPAAPRDQWMENNRKWINDRMDEGCTIYDCGPAPGRANYPSPTSPYYQMELDEIAKRSYPVIKVS